jgi:hypothetical protein
MTNEKLSRKRYLLIIHWSLIAFAVLYVCLNNINQNIHIALNLYRVETFGFYLKNYLGYNFTSFFSLFLGFLFFYCGIFLLFDFGKTLEIIKQSWGKTKDISLPIKLLSIIGIFFGVPSILIGKYRSCIWGDFGGGDGNYIFWTSLVGYLVAFYYGRETKNRHLEGVD